MGEGFIFFVKNIYITKCGDEENILHSREYRGRCTYYTSEKVIRKGMFLSLCIYSMQE